MPEVALGMDKKKLIIVGAVGLGGLYWWHKHQAAAASSTDTSSTDTTTADPSQGDTTDYGTGGFGAGGTGLNDGSGFGGYGQMPGAGAPVTGNSAGSTAPNPSRQVVVGKGETQKDIIQAAGISYADFLTLNPSLAPKGSKIHAGQKINLPGKA